jgi:RsiW-degrading membrane proteinase PrsW (M82 family)
MNEMPGGQLRNRLGSDSATPSELFPVLSKRKELINKGLLVPVGIAFLFGIILTATASTPEIFRNVFGVAIGLGCFYVLYSLGGKKKSWWVFGLATIFTMVLMLSPLFNVFFLVFYNMIGTPQGAAVSQLSFGRQVIARFFSTGMMEELVKIIPVLLIWKWTARMKSPLREKAGITEPLDGILIGAASALGFVFVETLMQYAPNAVMGVAGNIAKQLPQLPPELYVLAGDVFGLQSVILRILPELSGHMAYSGYFGYFVGLAAMKPKHMWKLLITGYVSAAGLHAIWDLFCDRPGVGVYLQLPMMIGFYAFLVAAILKARQISPLRAQNFATVVVNSPAAMGQGVLAGASRAPEPVPAPAPVRVAPWAPAAQPAPVAQPAARKPAPVDNNCMQLRIARKMLPLRDGERFADSDIPGLRSSSADGIVAAVSRNPKDPTMMGLQNLSSSTWKAALPNGDFREIPSGRSVRLVSATRIDFGLVQGEVA